MGTLKYSTSTVKVPHMAITNKERVGRALDTLREGLYPFVEREMRSVHNQYWERQAQSHLHEYTNSKRTAEERLKQDVADLINGT